ncbi:MAG: hypothetical protein ACTHMM_15835 [Agriterribacter sp.]
MTNTITPSERVPNPAHFLNQIALEYECDPYKLRLLSVLEDFFSYANLQQHLAMFDQFCMAAMQQEYAWKQGSPGNALFYAERLELLLEATYLLRLHPAPKQLKKAKRKMHRITDELPMHLSAGEYLKPRKFVDVFFMYASLPKWKKMLHAFMRNAISNGSVIDELPPDELLPFASYIKKLISAAYRITLLGKKTV